LGFRKPGYKAIVASVLSARELLKLVRSGVDVRSVERRTRMPFRFLLCGDPALIVELRALLLSGHADGVPLDAAACLETMLPVSLADPRDVRAAIFLGRRGDLAGADLEPLRRAKIPTLAITVDPDATAVGPPSAPARGARAEYVVPAINRDTLRVRFFPHLIDCASGVEIAVGRRLPPLRETVAAKLTRKAAASALKISVASALVDHLPVVGVVFGAVASAGDMVAITGVQMALMLHIEAAYGRDTDLGRLWRMLPIVGGGLGWRALARELSGFIPMAGIAIKGAIAYAGTIVVGESVTLLLEHGRTMSRGQAAKIFETTKRDALKLATDLVERFRRGQPPTDDL
jgi:uncharacterized protein (DUF697 family)